MNVISINWINSIKEKGGRGGEFEVEIIEGINEKENGTSRKMTQRRGRAKEENIRVKKNRKKKKEKSVTSEFYFPRG